MALVNVTNMIVLDNPSSFTNDFQFEIEFECLGELEDDLEWKVTYVGAADDNSKDQVLEEVMVGPVPQGVSKFVLTAEAPDTSLIPVQDLVGVTVVLVTCSYREKEFVRIGYYVNNEYYATSPLVAPPQPLLGLDGLPLPAQEPQPLGPEELEAMVQATGTIEVGNVYRNIMSDKPRVTRFQIDWTPQALLLQQQQQQAAEAAAAQQQQMQLQQQQAHYEHAQQQAAMMTGGGLPAPPLYGSGSGDIGMMGMGQMQQHQQQQQQQQQQQPPGVFGAVTGLGY